MVYCKIKITSFLQFLDQRLSNLLNFIQKIHCFFDDDSKIYNGPDYDLQKFPIQR